MGAGAFDNDYYYNSRVIYPQNRIIYVTQPGTVLVPQYNMPNGIHIPINTNPSPRIIYTNSQNISNNLISNNFVPRPMPQNRPMPIPMPMNRGMPMPIMNMPMQKQKKTIPNLAEYFEEVTLTQSILDKGEQKKCSICLEDFEVGNKIIYLPCFHYYHAGCIETWVKNSDKCPLCNIEIKIPH